MNFLLIGVWYFIWTSSTGALARSFRFRQRRDANDVLKRWLPSQDFLCSVQCNLKHSESWSKMSHIDAASFHNDSSLVPALAFGHSVISTAFGGLCSIQKNYTDCLKQCPPGVLSNSMKQGALALRGICDPQKNDSLSQSPCLYTNRQLIQDTCNGSTADLTAASNNLLQLHQSKDSTNRFFSPNALPSIRQLCSSATNQSSCILRSVRDRCGDQSSDMLKSILNASFAAFRQMIGDQMDISATPECATFFHAVENGAKTTFINQNSTSLITTIDPMNNLQVPDQFRNVSDQNSAAATVGTGMKFLSACVVFSIMRIVAR